MSLARDLLADLQAAFDGHPAPRVQALHLPPRPGAGGAPWGAATRKPLIERETWHGLAARGRR